MQKWTFFPYLYVHMLYDLKFLPPRIIVNTCSSLVLYNPLNPHNLMNIPIKGSVLHPFADEETEARKSN